GRYPGGGRMARGAAPWVAAKRRAGVAPGPTGRPAAPGRWPADPRRALLAACRGEPLRQTPASVSRATAGVAPGRFPARHPATLVAAGPAVAGAIECADRCGAGRRRAAW